MPLTSGETNKLRKRRGTNTSKKQIQHSSQLFNTRSEGDLPVNKKIGTETSKKHIRKENAKKKAKEELVTVFGSKKARSGEFNKKLTKFGKKFEKPEILEDSSEIRENVRNLLITKQNEIDIERIIALHLLSLRPAKKCFMLEFTETRGDDEDEEDRQLTRYSEVLPHYIIASDDIKFCNCFHKENRKSNKSEFVHITINRQVEELLNATIKAIKKSNPSKLEILWLQAYDTNHVKKLLNREKFRYLMTSMKYNLKWLLGYDVEDVKTEMCELNDLTFYRVNKNRDYHANTVFKLIIPTMIYRDILFDDRAAYYSRITNVGLRLIKGKKYLPHVDRLCIFQNPIEPAGIIILAENGQFISLINDPEFNNDNEIKFNNIAIYVLFYSPIKDHSDEWPEIIHKKERNKRSDEDSNEKLNEIIRKNIMKKMLKSLLKEEKRIYTNKYAVVKKTAKLNDENAIVKSVHVLKEVISINRILRTLSEFSLNERELMMKSSNYGGLGLARVIMGKNTMQLIKDMCTRQVTQLQVTPIHNANVLDTELSNVRLNIPENIYQIQQSLCKFEHSKANKLFLSDLETIKLKHFDV